MTIPEPRGLFSGDYFAFGLGDNPAAIDPYSGLTPVILDSSLPEAHGFPAEEFVHAASISRCLPLCADSLREHLRPDSDRKRVVKAWKPFVEATNSVYLESIHPEARNMNVDYGNTVWNIYGRKSGWRSSRTSTDADSTSAVDDSRTKFENTLARFTEKIRTIVRGYVDLVCSSRGRSLRTEYPYALLSERNRSSVERSYMQFTHQLVEIFVPFQLELRHEWALSHEPDEYWSKIDDLLDEWIDAIERDESPFPVGLQPIHESFSVFWTVSVCKVARVIGEVLRHSDQPERQLVKSLPAIDTLFNPFSFLGWYLPTITSSSLVATEFSYPLVLFDENTASVRLVDLFISHEQRVSIVEEKWDRCQFYSSTDVREYTNREEVHQERDENIFAWDSYTSFEEVHRFAVTMAYRIWRFLVRLEDMWWMDVERASGCPHCQYFFTLSPAEELYDVLGDRLFLEEGLEPLLQAAFMYPSWLTAEVATTYRRHPILGDP